MSNESKIASIRPDYAAANLPPFILLEEPKLSFSSDGQALNAHPLQGLLDFGPYTSTVFPQYTPILRVAIISTQKGYAHLQALLNLLQLNHPVGDRRDYVPAYPGFERVFGIKLAEASRNINICLPDNISEICDTGTPQKRLLHGIRKSLHRLSLVRDQFDVALIHLPDIWATAFRSPGFDAHDALKAIAAQLGIPTQIVNDRSFSFQYKASLSWRLAIALYVKAGGVPWKLSKTNGVPEETAYIGLAYALRQREEDTHFVTCCSQVFDMDGGGMQFVAFEARDPVKDVKEARRNPFLSREDMRAVLARSLQIYLTRNAGRLPKRMVIHKTTAFTKDEINGSYDALTSIPEVECIQIGNAGGWRGIWMRGPKQPDSYPVPRGTVQMFSGHCAAVWIAGNAPSVSKSGNYFQGQRSIPRPIMLTRHAGNGPLDITASEVLALSKMDWNNDALYDPLPVTIKYSQRLARTIANAPELPGNIYPYRLFM